VKKKVHPNDKCELPSGCYCSISALEPDDDCPTHGHNPHNKCQYCGKFMKLKQEPNP